MSQVFVHGLGAVSPAGWGMAPLREAVEKKTNLGTKEISRPSVPTPVRVRRVPNPGSRPVFISHPRLRRSSPVTQFAVAAALEAIGTDTALISNRSLRLGIVFCVMSGCVNYSRRFYDETLRDPTTASPLVFPETVFNAPSSHLAALLGTTAINYTIVGAPAAFLQGLALAADWLSHEPIDGCVVVGSEEIDWLTVDAFRLFCRNALLSEGAAAIYLRRTVSRPPVVELRAVTDCHPFTDERSRFAAAAAAQAQLPPGKEMDLLCDSIQGHPRLDAAETAAWVNWPGARVSPKRILGEGLMAAAGWQCVLAADALVRGNYRAAHVSVVSCNHQALGAHFSRVRF